MFCSEFMGLTPLLTNYLGYRTVSCSIVEALNVTLGIGFPLNLHVTFYWSNLDLLGQSYGIVSGEICKTRIHSSNLLMLAYDKLNFVGKMVPRPIKILFFFIRKS